VDTPLDGPVLGRLGQHLVDWRRPPFTRVVAVHKGVATKLWHRVPADPALVATPFHSQALVTGRGGARLTNALDGEFLPRSSAALGQGRGGR
jgi:hypothetical protein